MIAEIRWKVNRLGTVPRLSHAVQEICHCLLILLIGREAISEASGHLTRAGLCLGQVTTLGDQLLFVDVECFLHAVSMAQIRANCKWGCATLPTGRAADSVSVNNSRISLLHFLPEVQGNTLQLLRSVH